MKLRELIENQLIKDDDKIGLNVPIHGHVCEVKRGHWFNDDILTMMDREVTGLEWSPELGWMVDIESAKVEG